MKQFSVVFGFRHKVVEIELGSAMRAVDDTVTIRAGPLQINELSAERERYSMNRRLLYFSRCQAALRSRQSARLTYRVPIIEHQSQMGNSRGGLNVRAIGTSTVTT